jgi:methylthioribose-1-phosphate isomerase
VGASGARRSAAAAALRNAAPLSGSLDAELTALMTGAQRTGADLDSAVNNRAAARLAAHAEQAERLRVAIGDEGAVATGPGLGATSWGDLAPVHEAIRRSGRRELLIAAGPSVARGGRTSLGGLDAADAVRAGLAPTLLADVLLATRLVRGDIDTLLLASDLVAADGSAVVAVGGVALAVAARAGGARVILVAPSRDAAAEAHTAPTDAAALERRIADSMRSPGTKATASREAAAGVTTEGSRLEVLPAALIDAAP